MGVEEITKELLAQAAGEEKKALAEAREAEAKVLKQAEQQAKVLVDKAVDKARKLVEADEKERVAAAKLKGKRALAKAKGDKVEEVLAQVQEELKAFVKGSDYGKLHKHLVEQGKQAIGSGCVVTEDKLGGAIITSKDGLVRVDHTLPQLFEERKDVLRRAIAQELFK